MSYTVYKNLNMPIYPLVGSIDEYALTQEVNLFPISRLSPDLVKFLTDLKINLEDNFEIKKIHIPSLPPGESMTYGNYGMANQRTCTINWNFSTDPGVKSRYYSKDGANWTYYQPKDETVWTNTQFQDGDDWTSKGPILVNPQIPSKAMADNNQGYAIYVKLLFKETWSSIVPKLESVIEQ